LIEPRVSRLGRRALPHRGRARLRRTRGGCDPRSGRRLCRRGIPVRETGLKLNVEAVCTAMAARKRVKSEGKAHRFGGDWTSAKLSVLADHLAAYTKALKDKPSAKHPFRKAYIDAFAGTGYRVMQRDGGCVEEPALPGSRRDRATGTPRRVCAPGAENAAAIRSLHLHRSQRGPVYPAQRAQVRVPGVGGGHPRRAR